VTEIIVSPLV